MKKFLLRIGLALIGLIVILVLARNFVARKSVEVGVKRVTGFPLEIGAVSVGLFNGQLEVRDLKLTNPPEFKDSRFVDLPLFRVDYHTFSMLRGVPHIKDLVVNVVEVVVVRNEKGQTNANLIQEKLSPSDASTAGGEKKPASERKTPYRVDLMRVHIGTVVMKDFSKTPPTERRITLNREVVFKDITESTSISALVMNTILGPVGDVAGDLVKGVSGALKGTSDSLQKTGKGLLDNLKKVVPIK